MVAAPVQLWGQENVAHLNLIAKTEESVFVNNLFEDTQSFNNEFFTEQQWVLHTVSILKSSLDSNVLQWLDGRVYNTADLRSFLSKKNILWVQGPIRKFLV